MMSKWTNGYNTGKRKAAMAVVIGSMVVASLGGVSALAAGNGGLIWGQVDENGAMTYSTDEGKSWSSEKPEDVVMYAADENGVTSASTGNGTNVQLPDGSGEVVETVDISVKEEDGKTLYSVDGGKTWSETAEFTAPVQ